MQDVLSAGVLLVRDILELGRCIAGGDSPGLLALTGDAGASKNLIESALVVESGPSRSID